MTKLKTSFALTQDAIQLAELLSKKMGISKSSVIEIALRNLARSERVFLPEREVNDE